MALNNTFQMLKKVGVEALDEMQHVNNVEYLRWVQEISKTHWESLATKEMLDQYAWVALEHNIIYKAQAFLDDELRLNTYISEWGMATCIRVVEIYNADKLISKSKSNWCLIKMSTKKPTKITDDISAPFR